MSQSPIAAYNFIFQDFTCNKKHYKVALTPELFFESDGLDFTGNYVGILIGEDIGTLAFELEPDPHMRWAASTKRIDPGMIDELDKIISKLRNP